MRQLGITRIDDGDRLVGGLSGGERQALAIARAVHFGASVLILDEPTAALGVKEAAHVLRIVLQARRKGIAVIFITHNVVHALTVGDHFAVLIRGSKAADFRKGEKSREAITDLMAGGEQMAELGSRDRELQRNAVKTPIFSSRASSCAAGGMRVPPAAFSTEQDRLCRNQQWQSGLTRARPMTSRKRTSSASFTKAGHSPSIAARGCFLLHRRAVHA